MGKVPALCSAVIVVALGGVGVLGGASPAWAATAVITSPGQDLKLTANTTVTVSAHVSRNAAGDTGAFKLLGYPPDGSAPSLLGTASGTQSDVSAAVSSTCSPTSCEPMLNGDWVFSIQGKNSSDYRDVQFAIPPAAPRGLQATAVSDRQVQLNWQANAEPDLAGYSLWDSNGFKIGPDIAASDTEAVVTYSPSQAGGKHQYVLRAQRFTAPDSSSVLISPPCAPASVTMPAQQPTPSPAGPGHTAPRSATGSARASDVHPSTSSAAVSSPASPPTPSGSLSTSRVARLVLGSAGDSVAPLGALPDGSALPYVIFQQGPPVRVTKVGRVSPVRSSPPWAWLVGGSVFVLAAGGVRRFHIRSTRRPWDF